MSNGNFEVFQVSPLSSFDELRSQMPIIRCDGLYLDHAAAGVLPQPTVDAMTNRIQSAAEYGVRHWNVWDKLLQRTRRLLASVVGADDEEIAFVPNTAGGIGIVAEGIRWRDGDNVVLAATEFPSNRFSWLNMQRRGVEVRLVRPRSQDPQALYESFSTACDGRTRVLASSWVDYATGVRRDPARLAEIAHRHDALLVLDGIQGCGVFPVDLHAQDVDVIVSDSRKWLLGPEASGFMAIRSCVQDRIQVTRAGWAATEEPLNFELEDLRLSPTATRFESGMRNTFGLAGLHASLRLLDKISLEQRQHRLLQVRELFRDAGERAGLQPIEVAVEAQSGIVLFEHETLAASDVASRLRHHGVAVSVKGKRLRVSPHVYNNADDATKFATAVVRVIS